MRASGEYWFDLAMGFNVRDMAKVNRVFVELLSPGRARRHQTVQAKFYLSAETYERLRKEAAERVGLAAGPALEPSRPAVEEVLARHTFHLGRRAEVDPGLGTLLVGAGERPQERHHDAGDEPVVAGEVAANEAGMEAVGGSRRCPPGDAPAPA
jgi:hypothetical protein